MKQKLFFGANYIGFLLIILIPASTTAEWIDTDGHLFRLGDLYDRRSEKIVQGPEVWDEKTLTKVDHVPCRGSSFKISALKRLKRDTTAWGFKVRVTQSAMWGLWKSQSKGRHKIIRKKTEKSSVVKLKYRSTTRCVLLQPECLTNVTFSLPPSTPATDVVVGLRFGADSEMALRRRTFEARRKHTAEGDDLGWIFNSIVEGIDKVVGTLVAKQDDTDDVQVDITGDVFLPNLPQTFQQAVDSYSEIAQRLEEDEEKIEKPKMALIYPLAEILGLKEVQVPELSQRLSGMIIDLRDDLEDVVEEANDIWNHNLADYHPRLRDEVSNFAQLIEDFMEKLEWEVKSIILKIKSQLTDETSLKHLLQLVETSVFGIKNLRPWIREKTEESKVIFARPEFPRCASSGDLTAKMTKSKAEYFVVVLLQLPYDNNNNTGELFREMRRIFDINNNNNDEAFGLESLTPFVYVAIKKRRRWWRSENEFVNRLSSVMVDTSGWVVLEAKRRKEGRRAKVGFALREEEKRGPNSKASVLVQIYYDGKLISPNWSTPSSPGKPVAREKGWSGIMVGNEGGNVRTNGNGSGNSSGNTRASNAITNGSANKSPNGSVNKAANGISNKSANKDLNKSAIKAAHEIFNENAKKRTIIGDNGVGILSDHEEGFVTSITFDWTPPERGKENLREYEVTLYKMNFGGSNKKSCVQSMCPVQSTRTTQTNFHFKDLDFGSIYKIVVSSVASVKSSSSSSSSFVTARSKPSELFLTSPKPKNT